MSASRLTYARHENREPAQKIIAFEGNIASGKTTLTTWLTQNENIHVYPEPLDEWRSINGFNILEAFYQNPNQWIFPFQTYVILTMMRRHFEGTDKRVKVIERCLMSTRRCFIELLRQQNMIDETQNSNLQTFIDLCETHHETKPDEIYYIRTDPEKSYQRIHQRKRPEEAGIKLEYIQSLHQLYDDWLLNEKTITVHVINGNQSVHKIQEEITRKFKATDFEINQKCREEQREVTLQKMQVKDDNETDSKISENQVTRTSMSLERCKFCSETHHVSNCRTLMEMRARERTLLIRALNLCYKCLSKHSKGKCRLGDCPYCGGPHNTLLCYRKENIHG